jgi:hypothetical protein
VSRGFDCDMLDKQIDWICAVLHLICETRAYACDIIMEAYIVTRGILTIE